jgi:hypothetical protein
MKRILFLFTLGLIILLLSGVASFAAEVAQGKCVAYDKAKNEISIEEYDTNFSKAAPYGKPTGTIIKFDVTKAKIGIAPQPGDILRISYNTDGNTKKAIKVMNVSKQDLRKK